jgi:hypothetical protein
VRRQRLSAGGVSRRGVCAKRAGAERGRAHEGERGRAGRGGARRVVVRAWRRSGDAVARRAAFVCARARAGGVSARVASGARGRACVRPEGKA